MFILQMVDKEHDRNKECESVKRVKQVAKKKMTDAEIMAALRKLLSPS